MNKQKTFYLDEHGCAKNQVDAELIISCLQDDGWILTDEPRKASLIIINSCGFIKSAKSESLASLFTARNLYPNAKILLAGCLAERYAQNFKESLPEADGIFGNGDCSKITSVVKKMFQGERPVEVYAQVGVCSGKRNQLLNFKGSSYIKITEGCNNVCSFCAIPKIRGNLRSRPIKEIIEEIKSFLKRGIFEFNLIAQDLASYGLAENEGIEFGNYSNLKIKNKESGSVEWNNSDNFSGKSPLCVLLEEISKIEGDFWLRLLYIHPDNFPLDILKVIQNDKRILPYFDIPFQSGDDEIIALMNRHGNQKSYISLVEKIRSACKKTEYQDSCIRTTFLCGFPGETDKNALNTEDFIKKIQSDWSGNFVYSREDETPAFSMKNQIKEKIKKQRSRNLCEIQNEITSKRLLRFVGKILRVLVEEIIKDTKKVEGYAIGRAWFQTPDVDGNIVISYEIDDENAVKSITEGKTVNVEILSASGVDLFGKFVQC